MACFMCAFPFFSFWLFLPIHLGEKIGCQDQRRGEEDGFDHFNSPLGIKAKAFPPVSRNSFFFLRTTMKQFPDLVSIK
jgi:hypothetical protein